MNQALRTHIDGTTYRHVSEVRGRFDRETEVSDLVLSSRKEDIRDLDVPVNYR